VKTAPCTRLPAIREPTPFSGTLKLHGLIPNRAPRNGFAEAPRLARGVKRSDLDHHFADMLVGLEIGSSGGDPIERKGAVDDWPEPAIPQRREQVGKKSLGRFGALRRCAQAVADAVEMQAALGEPIDIELTLGDTAHPTDRHEPAADGERVEAG